MGRDAITLSLSLLLFVAIIARPMVADAGRLTLGWDAPTTNTDGTACTDLVGYRVYYGSQPSGASSPPCNASHVDVPASTTHSLDGLSEGTRYYIRITARDRDGIESTCSNETTGVAVATASTGVLSTAATATSTASPAAPASGGGGCFIATAAFGSPLAQEVGVLRDFRARYMFTNPAGRFLASAYARFSPPLADWLRAHETARTATRMALRPVVWWAHLALSSQALGLALAAGLLLAPPSLAVSVVRARRGRRGDRRSRA